MTTMSLPRYTERQRVNQARVLRSEWIKLRTQPSAAWSLASAVLLIIAFGVLYSLLREARPPQGAAAIRSCTHRSTRNSSSPTMSVTGAVPRSAGLSTGVRAGMIAACHAGASAATKTGKT